MPPSPHGDELVWLDWKAPRRSSFFPIHSSLIKIVVVFINEKSKTTKISTSWYNFFRLTQSASVCSTRLTQASDQRWDSATSSLVSRFSLFLLSIFSFIENIQEKHVSRCESVIMGLGRTGVCVGGAESVRETGKQTQSQTNSLRKS